LRHFRIAGLALALLSPVYGLIAWTVSESIGVALLAVVITVVGHLTYELLRLTLWALVYPGSAGLPQPPRPLPPTQPASLSPAPSAEPAPALPAPAPARPGEPVALVDQALRHLGDYAWLGESPLVARLGLAGETHIARGKALRHHLETAIEGLRPAGPAPRDSWPRAWQGYLVLRLAYLEDLPNREIIARLYLTESTFARLRRKAVRAVGQSLMERGVSPDWPSEHESVKDGSF
jgi:hypothetical protein